MSFFLIFAYKMPALTQINAGFALLFWSTFSPGGAYSRLTNPLLFTHGDSYGLTDHL
jgi:hypothetical protein